MIESNGDNQIVQEFLIESYEKLDNLERELVTLESHPDDKEGPRQHLPDDFNH